MVDWAAKRAQVESKLARVSVRGTITWKSKALNASSIPAIENVWVFTKERSVEKKDSPATVTVLVNTTNRPLDNGVLSFEGKTYQINSFEQVGAGSNHLLSKVVAVEL